MHRMQRVARHVPGVRQGCRAACACAGLPVSRCGVDEGGWPLPQAGGTACWAAAAGMSSPSWSSWTTAGTSCCRTPCASGTASSGAPSSRMMRGPCARSRPASQVRAHPNAAEGRSLCVTAWLSSCHQVWVRCGGAPVCPRRARATVDSACAVPGRASAGAARQAREAASCCPCCSSRAASPRCPRPSALRCGGAWASTPSPTWRALLSGGVPVQAGHRPCHSVVSAGREWAPRKARMLPS